MKLASYKDGSRDGQLLVVSRDLTTAHYATGIATRLQQVLDDWNFLSPQLQELSQTLNHGKARHGFAFDPRLCLAPLPRACHWAEAVADPTQPLRPHLVQGRSDHFLGACHTVRLPVSTPGDVDTEGKTGAETDTWCAHGQVAVVTGDIAPGTGPDAALDGVRLLTFVNGLQRASGHGTTPEAGPSLAFAPVAVTPDELGEAWLGGRVRLPLVLWHNGKERGRFDLGGDSAWHAGGLLARIAAVHGLHSGALVGTGAATAAMRLRLLPGDSLRLDVVDEGGASVFGAIEHALTAAED